MQSVSSRIWTRVAVSISYDDNQIFNRQQILGINAIRLFSKQCDIFAVY